MTPEQLDKAKSAFLDAMSEVPNAKLAAEIAGVHPSTAYRWRDKDELFAAAWDEAAKRGVDSLEAVAMQKAIAGDTTLMIFLLKAHDRAKFGDHQRIDVDQRNSSDRILEARERAVKELTDEEVEVISNE